MVSSVAQEEPLGLDEVMHILDEASQIRAYSHELEQKSRSWRSQRRSSRLPTNGLRSWIN